MKRILISLILIVVGVVSVMAQITAGTLSGTISGPDGALPGATVSVTSGQTGKELTQITDSSGNFRFPQLEAGTYAVKVTANGFKTYIANNLKVDVAREYTT